MAKKIMITPNAGENVKKLDHSYIYGGDMKWSSHSEKHFGSSKFHRT